jgi:sugar phosphate isomerase/epimerase
VSEEELLGLLDEHSIKGRLVEAVTVWAQDEGTQAIDAHVAPALDLAVNAGAQIVTAVCIQNRIASLDAAIRGFAHVCGLAAERGIRVSLEFLPWTSISDVDVAWEIVRRAGAANGGLLVDTWHWHRRNEGEDLRAFERIPAERIHVVQLCDAAAERDVHPAREALTGRLPPGEGVADLVGLLGTLDRMGADPIIAPEVFSHALVARGPHEMARRVADASRFVLARVRSG